MNINLKKYQEKAVEELIVVVKKLLNREVSNAVCVFQSPTGSGKTLMTAKFIEQIIIELPETDICFVWVSVGAGELHIQSKNSLERILGGSPRVSLVEEEFTGGRERIVSNEVVVVNWEKLRSKDRVTGNWKNKLMRDGENINFREVIAKTQEQRKIIMIIDESHIGATTERTSELRQDINADIVLEVSATPKLMPDAKAITNNNAGYVGVESADVIQEGMIKKELLINEKINEIADDELNSQEVIMTAAYEKRLELKELFERENIKINPLVLVQIPPAVAGRQKIEAIQKFLADRNITERKEGAGNGKLAIWLSEQKSDTLGSVSEPDNEIEFLIFKQAINTGWDCPRAHILVKLRELGSEIFEIQTVGRILRMPEQKHYATEDLNRGYIFTNSQSIIVRKEEYNPNIIKHLKATRKPVYKQLELTSYYKSRVDYGDVTSSFSKVFEKAACAFFKLIKGHVIYEQNELKVKAKGLVLDIDKYQQEIVQNVNVDTKDFDDIEGSIAFDESAKLTISGDDLQLMFEQIIKDRLGSFRGVKRSIPAVKTAIYFWFRNYLGSRAWQDEFLLIQKIFVANSNRAIFEDILAKAIDEYAHIRKKEIKEQEERSEKNYSYELAEEMFFNEHTDMEVRQEIYVYEPCYLSKSRSNPEKNFEKFLEENGDGILWWCKNGENKQDYLGIKYEYLDGDIHTFYPDYIVSLKDGRLGIFEVKDNKDRDGSSSTKAKAERLSEYIKNEKKKKLFGGIAIEVNGYWMINKKPEYNWESCLANDWGDWDKLEF